ncbi:MAG: hypothetical protein NXI31_17780 [bacterium]|nr:hypothetical protein [bacterium]
MLPLLALLGGTLAGQDGSTSDPYTRGDATALERAGYESLGPFPFGENHTSLEVEALLGDEKICWLETAHFRIGCAVSECSTAAGDKVWKKKVKAELKRLRTRLPKVKPSTRRLDPWLRTHLIAQRLEDCYAEVQRDLGVTGVDFPATAMPGDTAPEKYFGEGPHLGMMAKFSVLVTHRTASSARYTRSYSPRETDYPTRIYHPTYGGLGVVMAEEYNNSQLATDQVLHVYLVYNVVTNLLNGYRSYGHEMPAWIQIGMAHYYARRVDPRFPVYVAGDDQEDSAFWKWDERALGLIKFDAFRPVEELMQLATPQDFGMEDHIQAWFLVDYLLHARREATARFLREMSHPFHGRTRSPTHEEIVARQTKSFRNAFACDPEQLEATWKKATKRLKHRK